MSTSRVESLPLFQILTRHRVQSVFVDFDDVDQFSPAAVAKYEAALITALEKGIRIRALVLCNPHNPLGQSYPRETIIGLLKLSKQYNLHFISDEIYALSKYDNKASAPNPVPFESVLSLNVSQYIEPEYVQFTYGLSKDFAASGLRIGFLYTQNDDLLQAVKALSAFQWTGGPDQRAGIRILEDQQWLDGFFQRSSARLTSSYQLATGLLDGKKIQYRKGTNYGFFLWVDLRPFLRNKTWEAEQELSQNFTKNKVTINPGGTFASPEPGFFRVIYSQTEETLREGLRR